MNENRPRLKDSDEILQSLGKRVGAADEGAQAAEEPPVEQEPSPQPKRRGRPRKAPEAAAASGGEEAPQPEAAAPKKRRGRPPKTQKELEERIEQADANPLDFDKYELPKPKRRGRPPKNQAAPPREKAPAPPAEPEEVPREASRGEPEPELREFSFEAFTEAPAEAEPQQAPPPPAAAREEQPRKKPGRKPKPKEEEPPPVDVFQLAHDEESLNQFMENLGTQFEQRFTQRFAQRPQTPAAEVMERVSEEITTGRSAKRAAEASAIKDIPNAVLPEDEEAVIKAETESFLQQFEEETLQQEEVQQQDFKETLAEKFMRERERYLRELGIGEENAPEAQDIPEEPEDFIQEADAGELPGEEPHSRRVLDFQIQPEMHRRGGSEPQRPMTYGRNAVARPFDEAPEDDLPYLPREDGAGEVSSLENSERLHFDESSGQGSQVVNKKSAEQLLLELAAKNSISKAPFPVEDTPMAPVSKPAQPPAAAPPAQPPVLRAQELYKPMPAIGEAEEAPAAPEEAREKKEKKEKPPLALPKLPNKTVLISVIAGVIALCLIIWPLSIWLSLRSGSAAGPAGEDGLFPAVTGGGEVESIFEDRTFANRVYYDNGVVMRPGVVLENVTFNNSLTFNDSVVTNGTVTLRDVDVQNVYWNDSGINVLELDNVNIEKLSLNNEMNPVEIVVIGESSIGILEVKTNLDAKQAVPEEQALAADSVTLDAVQLGKALDVGLQGVSSQTLITQGEVLLTLENASVDIMTSSGSLLLEGNSRVQSLSASGREEEKLVLNLRGGELTNLYLQGPAEVNTAIPIVMAYTSDNLSLTGTGTIEGLSINEQFGTARLLVDIFGVNVQSLTANTQVRINNMGSSQINTLKANESVYTLGNKVNHLDVYADGVIYENRPDRITVASGVQPPQTMADNPHIDYNLTSLENMGSTDVSDDDVATTCNDPREAGGFIRGNGSADNPFEVSTAAQLAHVNSHLNAHFIQTADIDINDDSQFASGFTPIASGATPFSGVYDGGGYQIKNLRISSNVDNVGLFGRNIGTIRNVHVSSGDVSATGMQNGSAGGIVGFNYQDGLVSGCSNGALVTGTASIYTGGVVGYNYGARVRDSYNYAKITGAGTVGGVVGVSWSGSVIVSCYNAGTIDSEGTAGAVVGNNDSSTVTNCYHLADTAASAIGVGSGSAVEVTSDQLQSDQMIADLSVGAEDSPWIRGSGGYDYPMLKASVYIRESGEDPENPAAAAAADEAALAREQAAGQTGNAGEPDDDDGPPTPVGQLPAGDDTVTEV